MTIGEKIRFLRELMGITQAQLAEKSAIHPVSIRKYETNKMQPQRPQIERIAAALNVSYNALSGIENATLRLETVGDLMGVLIILCKSQILLVKGERETNDFLRPESITLMVNPLFKDFVSISIQSTEKALSLGEVSFNLISQFLLDEFLKWENMEYLYRTSVEEQGDNPNEETKKIIADFALMKEQTELLLQRSEIELDMSSGIRVRIPPQS